MFLIYKAKISLQNKFSCPSSSNMKLEMTPVALEWDRAKLYCTVGYFFKSNTRFLFYKKVVFLPSKETSLTLSRFQYQNILNTSLAIFSVELFRTCTLEENEKVPCTLRVMINLSK